MKLGFEEDQTPYSSGSQSARAWTERWVKDWVYCPNCGGAKINPFPNNSPVADFYCSSCKDEYELKWPAPGSADTELGVLMVPEVGHGEAEVYA
jgi:Dam-replacing family